MIVDSNGQPLPCFEVGRPYGREKILETLDLHEAVLVAVAAALHRGTSFEVRRVIPEPSGTLQISATNTHPLFTVTPNAIDFRKIKPEAILAVKAFAAGLVSNIDEVAPPEREGPIT